MISRLTSRTSSRTRIDLIAPEVEPTQPPKKLDTISSIHTAAGQPPG